MKKIIAMFMAVVMTVCMAIPAFAVTPALRVDMPEISKIEIKPNIDDAVYENAVDSWFKDHPIKLPADFKINVSQVSYSVYSGVMNGFMSNSWINIFNNN